MKALSVVIQVAGFMFLLLGASAADSNAVDILWASLAIGGTVLMILGRLLYEYAERIRQERARKSRRYRNYIETQKKMSA